MAMNKQYMREEPSRNEVDTHRGPLMLEFGAPWCGFCKEAQPLIERALALYDDVGHWKIEDGSGKPLGRSFKVKLWPTLVFIKDGAEVSRLVRPTDEAAIADALRGISPGQ
ncbi:thioredoxin family protein [Verticiella sediminum]|uniref:Thioredoxin family protein n=1 Tax=Verticiella sediminum TaxID=1247510 RepID=A0A556AT65_9BURK|nr:thioredoxin family protein [Verticiella sediminum]TSH95545.1 thioredoxin family protein [Verticiella sediminum]